MLCFLFFKKSIIFHIIYLYFTLLCPFSDKHTESTDHFLVLWSPSLRNRLRLVSWPSVLWLAKPPLVRVWMSRPSAQLHVILLYCKQWHGLYCLSIWARLRHRGYYWRGSYRTCASTAFNGRPKFFCCLLSHTFAVICNCYYVRF